MEENKTEFYRQWAEEAFSGNEYYKKLVLRANKHIDKDTIFSLRGTKAIRLESMMNTDSEFDNRESWGELIPKAEKRQRCAVDVTTWSSLVRNALDVIKPQLEYVLHTMGSFLFKDTYEACLKEILDENELKPNSNFPRRLFKEAEETDLIKSSVYLNNKNHLLKIFTDENGIDWYVCAVYTGEIILVLEALLDTIYSLMCDMDIENTIGDKPHHTLILTYINRDDLSTEQQEELDTIDEELTKLEMTKDLIKLQRKISNMTILLQQLYADVNDIQEKYNLPTVDDILRNK